MSMLGRRCMFSGMCVVHVPVVWTNGQLNVNVLQANGWVNGQWMEWMWLCCTSSVQHSFKTELFSVAMKHIYIYTTIGVCERDHKERQEREDRNKECLFGRPLLASLKPTILQSLWPILSLGVCPGLPVPDKPDGFCGRKATLKLKNNPLYSPRFQNESVYLEWIGLHLTVLD